MNYNDLKLKKYADGGDTTPPPSTAPNTESQNNNKAQNDTPVASGPTVFDQMDALIANSGDIVNSGGRFKMKWDNKGSMSITAKLPSNYAIDPKTGVKKENKTADYKKSKYRGHGYVGRVRKEYDKDGKETGKTFTDYYIDAHSYENKKEDPVQIYGDLKTDMFDDYTSSSSNQWKGDKKAVKFTQTFNKTNPDDLSFSEIKKLGFTPTLYTDMNQVRRTLGRKQGLAGEFGQSYLNLTNTIVGIPLSIATGTLDMAGTALTLGWDDGDYSNLLTRSADGIRNWRKRVARDFGWAAPLIGGGYFADTSEGSSGYWFSQFNNTIDSGSEFILSAYTSGGALSLAKAGGQAALKGALRTASKSLAKAGATRLNTLKAARAAVKAGDQAAIDSSLALSKMELAVNSAYSKAADYGIRAGSTLFSGYHEAAGAARDTYKCVYEYQLRMGMSTEEAKAAAEAAADTTATLVTITSAALNFTSMAPILSSNNKLFARLAAPKTKLGKLVDKADDMLIGTNAAKRTRKNMAKDIDNRVKKQSRSRKKMGMDDVDEADFDVATGRYKWVETVNKAGEKIRKKKMTLKGKVYKTLDYGKEIIQEGLEEHFTYTGQKYGEQQGKSYYERMEANEQIAKKLGLNSASSLFYAGMNLNYNGILENIKNTGTDSEAKSSFGWGMFGGLLIPGAMNRLPAAFKTGKIYDTYTEKDLKDGTIAKYNEGKAAAAQIGVGDVKRDAEGKPIEISVMDAIKNGQFKTFFNGLLYSSQRGAKDAERRAFNNAKREVATQINRMAELEQELRETVNDTSLSKEERDRRVKRIRTRLISEEAYVAARGGWSQGLKAQLEAFGSIDNETDLRDTFQEEVSKLEAEREKVKNDAELEEKEKEKYIKALQNEIDTLKRYSESKEPVTEAMVRGIASDINDNEYVEKALDALEAVEDVEGFYDQISEWFDDGTMEGHDYTRNLIDIFSRKRLAQREVSELTQDREEAKRQMQEAISEAFSELGPVQEYIATLISADNELEAYSEEAEAINEEASKLIKQLQSPTLRPHALKKLQRDYPDLFEEQISLAVENEQEGGELSEEQLAKKFVAIAQNYAARKKNIQLEALNAKIKAAQTKRQNALNSIAQLMESNETFNSQLSKLVGAGAIPQNQDKLIEGIRGAMKGNADANDFMIARQLAEAEAKAAFYEASEIFFMSAGAELYKKKVYRNNFDAYEEDLEKLQKEMFSFDAKKKHLDRAITELEELKKAAESTFSNFEGERSEEENTIVEVLPDGDIVFVNKDNGNITHLSRKDYHTEKEQRFLDKYGRLVKKLQKIQEIRKKAYKENADLKNQQQEIKKQLDDLSKAERQRRQQIAASSGVNGDPNATRVRLNEDGTISKLPPVSQEQQPPKGVETKEDKENDMYELPEHYQLLPVEEKPMEKKKKEEVAKKKEDRVISGEDTLELANDVFRELMDELHQEIEDELAAIQNEENRDLKRAQEEEEGVVIEDTEEGYEAQKNADAKGVIREARASKKRTKKTRDAKRKLEKRYEEITGRPFPTALSNRAPETKKLKKEEPTKESLRREAMALQEAIAINEMIAASFEREMRELEDQMNSVQEEVDELLTPLRSQKLLNDTAAQTLDILENTILTNLPEFARRLYEDGRIDFTGDSRVTRDLLIREAIKEQVKLGKITKEEADFSLQLHNKYLDIIEVELTKIQANDSLSDIEKKKLVDANVKKKFQEYLEQLENPELKAVEEELAKLEAEQQVLDRMKREDTAVQKTPEQLQEEQDKELDDVWNELLLEDPLAEEDKETKESDETYNEILEEHENLKEELSAPRLSHAERIVEIAKKKQQKKKLEVKAARKKAIANALLLESFKSFEVLTALNNLNKIENDKISYSFNEKTKEYEIYHKNTKDSPLSPMTQLLIDLSDLQRGFKLAAKEGKTPSHAARKEAAQEAIAKYMKAVDMELNAAKESHDSFLATASAALKEADLLLDENWKERSLFEKWLVTLDKAIEDTTKNTLEKADKLKADAEETLQNSPELIKLYKLKADILELKYERDALAKKRNEVQQVVISQTETLMGELAAKLDTLSKGAIKEVVDLASQIESLKKEATELQSTVDDLKKQRDEVQGRIEQSNRSKPSSNKKKKGKAKYRLKAPTDKNKKQEPKKKTKSKSRTKPNKQKLKDRKKNLDRLLATERSKLKAVEGKISEALQRSAQVEQGNKELAAKLASIKESIKKSKEENKKIEEEGKFLVYSDLENKPEVKTSEDILEARRQRNEKLENPVETNLYVLASNLGNEFDPQAVKDSAGSQGDYSMMNEHTSAELRNRKINGDNANTLFGTGLALSPAQLSQVSADIHEALSTASKSLKALGLAKENTPGEDVQELLQAMQSNYIFKQYADLILAAATLNNEEKAETLRKLQELKELYDKADLLNKDKKEKLDDKIASAEKQYITSAKILFETNKSIDEAQKLKAKGEGDIEKANDSFEYIHTQLESARKAHSELQEEMDRLMDQVIDMERTDLNTALETMKAAIYNHVTHRVNTLLTSQDLAQRRNAQMDYKYISSKGQLVMYTTGVSTVYIYDENGKLVESHDVNAETNMEPTDLLGLSHDKKRKKAIFNIPTNHSFLIVTNPILLNSEKVGADGKPIAINRGAAYNKDEKANTATAAFLAAKRGDNVIGTLDSDTKFPKNTLVTFHRASVVEQGAVRFTARQQAKLERLKQEKASLEQQEYFVNMIKEMRARKKTLLEQKKKNGTSFREEDAEKAHKEFLAKVEQGVREGLLPSLADLPQTVTDTEGTFEYVAPTEGKIISLGKDLPNVEVTKVGNPNENNASAPGFHLNDLEVKFQDPTTGSYFKLNIIEAVNKENGDVVYVVKDNIDIALEQAREMFKEDLAIYSEINDDSDKKPAVEEEESTTETEEEDNKNEDPKNPEEPKEPKEPKKEEEEEEEGDNVEQIKAKIKTYVNTLMGKGTTYSLEGSHIEITNAPVIGAYNAETGQSIVKITTSLPMGNDVNGNPVTKTVVINLVVNKDLKVKALAGELAKFKKVKAESDRLSQSDPKFSKEGREALLKLLAAFETMKEQKKAKGEPFLFKDFIDIVAAQNTPGAPLKSLVPMLINFNGAMDPAYPLEIRIVTKEEMAEQGGDPKGSPGLYTYTQVSKDRRNVHQLFINVDYFKEQRGENSATSNEFEVVIVHELLHAVTALELSKNTELSDSFVNLLMDLAGLSESSVDENGTPLYDAVQITDRDFFDPNGKVWENINKKVNQRNDLTAAEKIEILELFKYIASHHNKDSGNFELLAETLAIFVGEPVMAKFLKGEKVKNRYTNDGVPVESNFWTSLVDTLLNFFDKYLGGTAYAETVAIMDKFFEIGNVIPASPTAGPNPNNPNPSYSDKANIIVSRILNGEQKYFSFADENGVEHQLIIERIEGDTLHLVDLKDNSRDTRNIRNFSFFVAKGKENDYETLNKLLVEEIASKIANTEDDTVLNSILTQLKTPPSDINEESKFHYYILNKEQKDKLEKAIKDKKQKKLDKLEKESKEEYLKLINELEVDPSNPEAFVNALLEVVKQAMESKAPGKRLTSKDDKMDLLDAVNKRIYNEAILLGDKHNEGYTGKIKFIKTLLTYPGKDETTIKALNSIVKKLMKLRETQLKEYMNVLLEEGSSPVPKSSTVDMSGLTRTAVDRALQEVASYYKEEFTSIDDLSGEQINMYVNLVLTYKKQLVETEVRRLFLTYDENERALLMFINEQLNGATKDKADELVKEGNEIIKAMVTSLQDQLADLTFQKLHEYTGSDYGQLSYKVPPAERHKDLDYKNSALYRIIYDTGDTVTVEALDGTQYVLPSSHVYQYSKRSLDKRLKEVIPSTNSIFRMYTTGSSDLGVSLSPGDVQSVLRNFALRAQALSSRAHKGDIALSQINNKRDLLDFFGGNVRLKDTPELMTMIEDFIKEIEKAVEEKGDVQKKISNIVSKYMVKMSDATFKKGGKIKTSKDLVGNIIYQRIQEKLKYGLSPGDIIQDMQVVIHTKNSESAQTRERQMRKRKNGNATVNDFLTSNLVQINDAKRKEENRPVIGVSSTGGVNVTIKIKVKRENGKSEYVTLGFPNYPNALVRVPPNRAAIQPTSDQLRMNPGKYNPDEIIIPYHPGIILNRYNAETDPAKKKEILDEFYELYDVAGELKKQLVEHRMDPSSFLALSPEEVLRMIGENYNKMEAFFENLKNAYGNAKHQLGGDWSSFVLEGEDINELFELTPTSGAISFNSQTKFTLDEVKDLQAFHPFYDGATDTGRSLVILDTSISGEKGYELDPKNAKLITEKGAFEGGKYEQEELRELIARDIEDLREGAGRFFLILRDAAGVLRAIPIVTANAGDTELAAIVNRMNEFFSSTAVEEKPKVLIQKTEGKNRTFTEAYDLLKNKMSEAFYDLVEEDGDVYNKGVFFKIPRNTPEGKIRVEIVPSFVAHPSTILKGKDKITTEDLDPTTVTVKITKYDETKGEESKPVYIKVNIENIDNLRRDLANHKDKLGVLGISVPMNLEYNEILEKFSSPVNATPFERPSFMITPASESSIYDALQYSVDKILADREAYKEKKRQEHLARKKAEEEAKKKKEEGEALEEEEKKNLLQKQKREKGTKIALQLQEQINDYKKRLSRINFERELSNNNNLQEVIENFRIFIMNNEALSDIDAELDELLFEYTDQDTYPEIVASLQAMKKEVATHLKQYEVEYQKALSMTVNTLLNNYFNEEQLIAAIQNSENPEVVVKRILDVIENTITTLKDEVIEKAERNAIARVEFLVEEEGTPEELLDLAGGVAARVWSDLREQLFKPLEEVMEQVKNYETVTIEPNPAVQTGEDTTGGTNESKDPEEEGSGGPENTLEVTDDVMDLILVPTSNTLTEVIVESSVDALESEMYGAVGEDVQDSIMSLLNDKLDFLIKATDSLFPNDFSYLMGYEVEKLTATIKENLELNKDNIPYISNLLHKVIALEHSILNSDLKTSTLYLKAVEGGETSNRPSTSSYFSEEDMEEYGDLIRMILNFEESPAILEEGTGEDMGTKALIDWAKKAKSGMQNGDISNLYLHLSLFAQAVEPFDENPELLLNIKERLFKLPMTKKALETMRNFVITAGIEEQTPDTISKVEELYKNLDNNEFMEGCD